MYESFSNEELIEAYKSMVAYSGEPSKEMLDIIAKRGGMDAFKRKIEEVKTIEAERKRIAHEVFSLCGPGADVELVTKLITSDIIAKKELDEFVRFKFFEFQSILHDKAITKKTITGSLIGGLVACVVGAVVWCLLFQYLPPIFLYAYIVVIYFVDYLVISLITQQSRKNMIVFIIAFLSTIASIILGVYLLKTILPSVLVIFNHSLSILL